MSVKYTDEQMEKIKGMIGFAEIFADQILLIMRNHGLDKVEGCNLMLNINPAYDYTTREIRFGNNVGEPSGCVHLSKGMHEKDYSLFMANSPEYEDLFSPFKMAEEKPLPPDGLWIGG